MSVSGDLLAPSSEHVGTFKIEYGRHLSNKKA